MNDRLTRDDGLLVENRLMPRTHFPAMDRRFMSRLFAWCVALVSSVAGGADGTAVVNPGFEDSSPVGWKERRPEAVAPAAGWNGWLAHGPASGVIRQGGEPHSGQKALEMRVLGADPAKYGIHVQQSVAVQSGRKLRMSFFAKRQGSVNGWGGVRFFDTAGKKVGDDSGIAIRNGDEYRRFDIEATAPVAATRADLMFRVMTRNEPAHDAAVWIDDVQLAFDEVGVLENDKLVVRLEPAWGGRIRSLALKTPAGPRETLVWLGPQAGGGGQTMIPAQKSDFLHDQPYTLETVEPLKSARVGLDLNFTDPSRAAFNGLRLEKTFSLVDNAAVLGVRLRLVNTSDRPMEVPMRERQCLLPRPATWSWPFNDWLKVLDRKDGLMNSQVRTGIGRGWIAAAGADGLTATVVLDPGVVQEAYSYFSGDVDTMEWYYAPVKLSPGGTWETSYSIGLIEDRGLVFGADASAVCVADLAGATVENIRLHPATVAEKARVSVDGKALTESIRSAESVSFAVKENLARIISVALGGAAPTGVLGGKGEGRLEWVELAVAPPPPPPTELPAFFSEVFPFMAQADFLYYPEGSGGGDTYVNTMARLPRDLRMAGFNGIVGGRITQHEYASKLVAPDGVNRYARDAKRYGLFLSDFTHYLGKTAEETNRKFWGRLDSPQEGGTSRGRFPFAPAFLGMCDDGLIPFLQMSDEPPTSQIAELGKVVAKLKELRHDVVYFPVINMNLYDFAPYAPVYCGDFYPIKSAAYGGRNPWATGPLVRKAAQTAKTSPVWLIAQGFGYPAGDLYGTTAETLNTAGTGQYILPSAGEMRLMVNLAVANGAKGIEIYGMGRLGWRYKKWYFHTVYDNAGATTEAFEAASESARMLTAVGPTLLKTDPAAVGDVSATSEEVDFGKFYVGPAITMHALTPRQGAGVFLCAVNMDPEKSREGRVAFGNNHPAVIELSSMRKVAAVKAGAGRSDRVVLAPGGMQIYFAGPEVEAATVWQKARTGHARNAVDLLRIDLDRALSNGMRLAQIEQALAVANEAIAAGRGDEAWEAVTSARHEFDKKLSGTPLDEGVAALGHARTSLSAASQLLRDHFPRFVPLDVFEKTKENARFDNAAHPKTQAAVDAVAADFTDLWRIEREMWEGKASAAAEAKTLVERARDDLRKIRAIAEQPTAP